VKALFINGSPRKNGNTAFMLNKVLKKLEKSGIEVEVYQLGGKAIRGCMACMMCAKKQDSRCIVKSDSLNEIIEKMLESDAVVIGSPTYFGNVSTEVKALIDRAGLVGMVNNGIFKHKIGAGVVAVRRGGSVEAFHSINNLFHLNQMIIPGSGYWTIGYGLAPEDVASDEESMRTLANLADNMIWLLDKIK